MTPVWPGQCPKCEAHRPTKREQVKALREELKALRPRVEALKGTMNCRVLKRQLTLLEKRVDP